VIFTGTGMSDVVQQVFAGKADVGCGDCYRPRNI
jgi:hypothetical protein